MNQWLSDFLSGSISGMLGTFFGHPLDTIKCRLQVSSKQYANTFISLAKIVKEERAFGLFKGVVPPVLNQFPINAILFSEFYRMHRYLDTHTNYSKSVKYFLGGTWSGLVYIIINTPCELIKCRQQLTTDKFISIKEITQNIIKNDGLFGLYRGICVSFNRDVFSFGFYFCFYYTLKEYFEEKGFMNSFALMLAGGITGVFTWLSTYPFDTLKTIIQADKSKETLSQSAAYKILVNETNSKFVGLYKGILPTLIRAFVVNAVIFYTNEMSQTFLNKII